MILNEDASVYRQSLQDQITQFDRLGHRSPDARPAGRHLCPAPRTNLREDRVLLQSVARVVLADENGTLAEQLERPGNPAPLIPALAPIRLPSRESPGRSRRAT